MCGIAQEESRSISENLTWAIHNQYIDVPLYTRDIHLRECFLFALGSYTKYKLEICAVNV